MAPFYGWGSIRFDQYPYPNGCISFGSTKVTGITKSSGKLFCHGKLVDAVEVNMGLKTIKIKT